MEPSPLGWGGVVVWDQFSELFLLGITLSVQIYKEKSSMEP